MAIEMSTKEIITIILLILSVVLILIFVLDYFEVIKLEMFTEFLGLGEEYGQLAASESKP